MVQAKLFEDWVDTISPNGAWVCANYASQLVTNFYGANSVLNYNGYNGSDLDSIYFNQGTLKDNGKYGLPVTYVSISFDNAEYGHAMNAILTGDNALNWNDWNFIEPQFDQMNVQPGQAYMPGVFSYGNSLDTVNGYINILNPKNGGILVEFRIKNGVPTLVYNENLDMIGVPSPLLINKRDSLPPGMFISSPIRDYFYNINPKLSYTFSDSTLKEVWYCFDNVNSKNYLYQDRYEYQVIGQDYCYDCTEPYWYDVYGIVLIDSTCGNRNINLNEGNHKLIISANDYFNNKITDTINFNIDKTPPIIYTTSPIPGFVYKEDQLSFSYLLRDNNLDLKNCYFKFNGEVNYFTDSLSTILIYPKEGMNELEIYAQDLAKNSVDNIITYGHYSINGIYDTKENINIKFYPNPVRNSGVFEIENHEYKEITLTLYDLHGKGILKRTFSNTKIIIDFSNFPSGFITYNLSDKNGLIKCGTIIKK